MPLDETTSPFTDEFLRAEVDFYGHPEPFERHGLTIDYVRPQMRCDDYLNVNMHLDPGFDVPVLVHSGRLWMSLTWMEVQSHWVPILMASGHVAAVGLGLGYFVLRVLDHVTHVTVFESNENVIRWFVDTHGHRLGDKVAFVHGDARESCVDRDFDMLYVDPYDTLCPDHVVDDIELFCSRNRIGNYRFWGQELITLLGLHAGHIDPVSGVNRWERALFSHFLQSQGSRLRPPAIDPDLVSRVCEMLEVFR